LIIKGLQKLRSILRTMSADFGRFLCGFGRCWSPFLVRFPGGGVCVFSKVVFFSFTAKLGAYNVRNGSPALPAHSWRRFAPSADVWCLFFGDMPLNRLKMACFCFRSFFPLSVCSLGGA
jgi:hypothetical protein